MTDVPQDLDSALRWIAGEEARMGVFVESQKEWNDKMESRLEAVLAKQWSLEKKVHGSAEPRLESEASSASCFSFWEARS